MTAEDLQLIPGLQMLGPDDDLQEQEMGFRMKVWVPDREGMFTNEVEIEVRCPQINALILLNQATVYRTDGEELPLEFTADNLQRTLTGIAASHQKSSQAKAAAKQEVLDSSAQAIESRAAELIHQAAKLVSPSGLTNWLQLCGQAYVSATTLSK